MQRTKCLLAIGVVLLIVGIMSYPSQNHADASSPFRIAIPLYSNQPDLWAQASSNSPSVGIIVMNPSNGPGSARDSAYTSLVSSAHQAGVKVLGYVDTQYATGAVSLQQAEQLVDDYYTWYGVDGIFFDDTPYACTNQSLNYYSTLYNYTKLFPGSGIVVLNPGLANGVGECYASVSDVLVTFEGTYATYVGFFKGENWTSKYPSSHFWNIIYNASSAGQMENAASIAASLGVGWIYVANLDGASALATLPSYFSEEVALVGLPARSSATQGIQTTTITPQTVVTSQLTSSTSQTNLGSGRPFWNIIEAAIISAVFVAVVAIPILIRSRRRVLRSGNWNR